MHTSEDSLSQGTGGISEISDEAMPILGRRATREKIISKSRYSDDSDSDIDIYKVISTVNILNYNYIISYFIFLYNFHKVYFIIIE